MELIPQLLVKNKLINLTTNDPQVHTTPHEVKLLYESVDSSVRSYDSKHLTHYMGSDRSLQLGLSHVWEHRSQGSSRHKSSAVVVTAEVDSQGLRDALTHRLGYLAACHAEHLSHAEYQRLSETHDNLLLIY